MAALSARALKMGGLLNELMTKSDAKNYTSLVKRICTMIGASGTDAEVHSLLNVYAKNSDAGIIEGLSGGLRNRRTPFKLTSSEQTDLLTDYFNTTSAERSQGILNVLKRKGVAEEYV